MTAQQRRELRAWLEEQDALNSRASKQWGSGLQRAVISTVIGLAAFVAAEGFLFHSGWYSKYLEPDSMAGTVEHNHFWLLRMWPPKIPDVLVLGDSRIGEGLSTRAASAAVGDRVHFTNLGMPGTVPRVWYYALRDIDKDRNRFSAIVIALDRYSDLDGADMQNRREDLNYLAGRLTLSDCPAFARSFSIPELRRIIFTGCVFRGTLFRQDIREFLSDVPGRLKRTRDWRNNGAGYIAGYGGMQASMAGITFDAATKTIHFPPGAQNWQIDSARATMTPDPAPQTGRQTAYRREWLGAILDLYKGSKTRIVFLQLPNAPLPIPNATEPARFLQSVASRRNVEILPIDTFRYLQRPELFADGLHLNQDGRKLFSEKLAQTLRPIVEPH